MAKKKRFLKAVDLFSDEEGYRSKLFDFMSTKHLMVSYPIRPQVRRACGKKCELVIVVTVKHHGYTALATFLPSNRPEQKDGTVTNFERNRFLVTAVYLPASW